ncbi:MAG: asparagine synthase-related protein [Acidobacteria bacterium]|nr:asparagine synthase-related protein [Acidobacteriota bacterium]
MMRLMAHRGPDGVQSEIDGLVGLAHARMALRHDELKWRAQPVWLPNRSKAIVADARLYNRTDLLSRLGAVEWFRDLVSDAEIILALFERYGEATPDLLDGDFAFVIWDAGSRRVFAARDPFGVKPLVYWSRGDRFVFASEPKQILCLPYVPVEPDDLAVGEVLVNRYQDAGRTFFEDVRFVRSGHMLSGGAGDALQETRHWHPDPGRSHTFANQTELFEGVRFHLKEAVVRRLQMDCPAIAELSGGYDSSAVVVMAAAGYREGSIACPKLETLSALYPGLDCDEREYSESISSHVPFARRTYVALEPEQSVGLLEEFRRLDAPYAQLPDGESLAVPESFAASGARVVLTGTGGDQVLFDAHILRDLSAAGSYLALARLLWSIDRIVGRRWTHYPRALARLAAPAILKRSLRRIRPHAPWRAPGWLRPDFAAEMESYVASEQRPRRLYPSVVQQTVFTTLASARVSRILEILEQRRAHMGVELRHPFLDRRFVEFVLAIPFYARIPDSGRPKYLLRQALHRDLPAKVRDRVDKAAFGAVQRRGLEDLGGVAAEPAEWALWETVSSRCETSVPILLM